MSNNGNKILFPLCHKSWFSTSFLLESLFPQYRTLIVPVLTLCASSTTVSPCPLRKPPVNLSALGSPTHPPHHKSRTHLTASVVFLLNLLNNCVMRLFTCMTPLPDCEAPEVRYSVLLISESLLPLLGQWKV